MAPPRGGGNSVGSRPPPILFLFSHCWKVVACLGFAAIFVRQYRFLGLFYEESVSAPAVGSLAGVGVVRETTGSAASFASGAAASAAARHPAAPIAADSPPKGRAYTAETDATTETLAPTAAPTTASTSASTLPREAEVPETSGSADSELVELGDPSPPPSPPPTAALQLLDLGREWKKNLKKKLAAEEKVRGRGTKPKGKLRASIRKNFKRLNDRLAAINATAEIDDPSRYHFVTHEGYQSIVEAARTSLDEALEAVRTDCVLWLVPPTGTITALEVERDDADTTSHDKNPLAGPLLRFQCGTNATDLSEDPCGASNLCRVRSDPGRWREYYASSGSNEPDAFKSRYNHTELEERLMPSSKDHPDASSSAILTMVDTVQYLRYGKSSTSLKKQQIFIWECFLNKASYALQTNRDFYIWIGGVSENEGGGGDDKVTVLKKKSKKNPKGSSKKIKPQPVLHQRNTEEIARVFGTTCNPESPDKNVVHYYKPVAFGAYFQKIAPQRNIGGGGGGSSPDPRAWFIDADIFFNPEAFPSVPAADSGDDDGGPLSLDDYFDISPQASLLGSQNPSGKDENILINGGLLGLRNRGSKTLEHPFDDWVLDFSALWWYCRCGERDQIALWLLLFATWSAESSFSQSEARFSYPGVAFENYLFAWFAVIPHARIFLPVLQRAWARDTAVPAHPSAWTTVPTNTSLFDGGDGFSGGGVYTYPLELPHVLLLPLGPFRLPPEAGTRRAGAGPRRTDFPLGIVRKNQPDKKAILTHNKNMRNACYNFQCWPFLIREDPSSTVDGAASLAPNSGATDTEEFDDTDEPE